MMKQKMSRRDFFRAVASGLAAAALGPEAAASEDTLHSYVVMGDFVDFYHSPLPTLWARDPITGHVSRVDVPMMPWDQLEDLLSRPYDPTCLRGSGTTHTFEWSKERPVCDAADTAMGGCIYEGAWMYA